MKRVDKELNLNKLKVLVKNKDIKAYMQSISFTKFYKNNKTKCDVFICTDMAEVTEYLRITDYFAYIILISDEVEFEAISHKTSKAEVMVLKKKEDLNNIDFSALLFGLRINFNIDIKNFNIDDYIDYMLFLYELKDNLDKFNFLEKIYFNFYYKDFLNNSKAKDKTDIIETLKYNIINELSIEKKELLMNIKFEKNAIELISLFNFTIINEFYNLAYHYREMIKYVPEKIIGKFLNINRNPKLNKWYKDKNIFYLFRNDKIIFVKFKGKELIFNYKKFHFYKLYWDGSFINEKKIKINSIEYNNLIREYPEIKRLVIKEKPEYVI